MVRYLLIGLTHAVMHGVFYAQNMIGGDTTMPHKNITVGKRKRDAMLGRQDRQCALCTALVLTTAEAHHDTATNRMLCRKCGSTVNAFRAATKRGLTLTAIKVYLALPALAVPDVPCTVTISQQRAAGRQAVVDGRVPGMDIAEYDRQFGSGMQS